MVYQMIKRFVMDNPVSRLVFALVGTLEGLVHVLRPQDSLLAVLSGMDFVGLTIQSGSLTELLVRVVGVGVVLIGVTMLDMVYDEVV